MATCPQCGKHYDEGLTFCLDDGSLLRAGIAPRSDLRTEQLRNPLTQDQNEPETVIKRMPSAGLRSPVFMTLIVVLLLIAGGFAVLAGLGIAGYVLFSSTGGNEYTQDMTSPSPGPSPTTNPFPVEKDAEPIPVGEDNQLPDNKVKVDSKTVDIRKEVPSTPVKSPTPVVGETRNAPADSKAPVPKQISGGVLNGKAVSLPKPPYPPAARAVRASGPVTVQVLVDENGNVVSARAVSGHPLLRAAAAAAARRARFSPTMLAGQPVKVSGVLTYMFHPPAS